MNKNIIDIIKFISKNKNSLKNPIKKDLYKHSSIIKIIKICKDIMQNESNFAYKINEIKNLPKLHNKTHSSLYDFFKQYFNFTNKNITFNSYKEFVKYYTYMQHSIDLNKILKDIHLNENLVNMFNNIYKNKERKEICEIFYENKFVSIDVLTELEINNLKNIKIDEIDFNLSLYYYDNIDNIDNYLKNIIIIIKIIKNINKVFNYDDIKINLVVFLGNCKKHIQYNHITPLSMNSGSSIPTIYANIWRKEEYEKVLIHELLHFIEADFYSHEYSELEHKINNIFNYKCFDDGINSSNESYNETLAGIINMCYKSVKYKININKIYEIELNFLYIQTAKLIKFFNGNSINDLFENKICIKQTTSAISYIILKMILFHFIDSTIDFIEKINLKCNEPDKIKLFSDFIVNLINTKSYFNKVDYYILKINNIKNDHYIKKNLRMSLV